MQRSNWVAGEAMTDPISESEPIPGEPAANGPSTADPEAPLSPGPLGHAPPDFPPPASTTADALSPVVEKIRRRVRTQTQPPPPDDGDRMRTLEERMIRLEALLSRQFEVEPAERVPEPPVASAAPPTAEIAAPVAAVVSDAPVAAVVSAAPVAQAVEPASEFTPGRWRWLLLPTLFQALSQAFNNFRLFLRMYVDPRYRMSWLGRLVPLAFVVFFIISDMDLPFIGWFFFWNKLIGGGLINKAILLLFAWLTVRVLSREMRRYQETIPDVPEALRWTNR